MLALAAASPEAKATWVGALRAASSAGLAVDGGKELARASGETTGSGPERKASGGRGAYVRANASPPTPLTLPPPPAAAQISTAVYQDDAGEAESEAATPADRVSGAADGDAADDDVAPAEAALLASIAASAAAHEPSAAERAVAAAIAAEVGPSLRAAHARLAALTCRLVGEGLLHVGAWRMPMYSALLAAALGCSAPAASEDDGPAATELALPPATA